MDIFAKIAVKIIEEQEAIIGPVAIEQANEVEGLTVNWENRHTVEIAGDRAGVIDELVNQYQQLFGQISVEVSKEAASSLVGQLQPNQLPESLK